ncbi:hypothetical protein CRUP_012042, partial [Coryphaenoides rupestris]
AKSRRRRLRECGFAAEDPRSPDNMVPTVCVSVPLHRTSAESASATELVPRHRELGCGGPAPAAGLPASAGLAPAVSLRPRLAGHPEAERGVDTARWRSFVAMVTWTVPELMSAKQTAQLVLGLRARIYFPIYWVDYSGVGQGGDPRCAAIQALVNKLKVPAGALIAGLVYKLEQLLPVPNLSQVAHLRLGTMLPSQPSVLEECGHFMPDRDDLTALLRHQKQKGFLTTSAISTTVGDCVLSSLSFLPDPLEPAGTQQAEEPRAPDPEPAAGRPEDPGVEEEEAGGEATVDRADNVDTSGGTDACDGPAGLTPDIGRDVQEILSSAVAHAPPVVPQEACTTQEGEEAAVEEVGGDSCDAPPSEPPQPPATTHHMDVEEAVALLETATVLAETETANRQPLLIERPIPFRVVHVPIRSAPSAVAGVPEGEGQQRPQIQRVTLHQWVSQMASNSLSLPTLPPLSPPRAGDIGGGGGLRHGGRAPEARADHLREDAAAASAAVAASERRRRHRPGITGNGRGVARLRRTEELRQ